VAPLTPPSRAYRYGVVVSDGQRTGSRVVSWHRTRAFAARAGVRYLDRHRHDAAVVRVVASVGMVRHGGAK
jgi:hypothetical protein